MSMLKDTLLHILFVGVVVFAASFLKKDTVKLPDGVVQTREVVTDYDHYPYNTNVTDTLSVKRK